MLLRNVIDYKKRIPHSGIFFIFIGTLFEIYGNLRANPLAFSSCITNCMHCMDSDSRGNFQGAKRILHQVQ